ncbi:MAG TPA: Xaa-Pro aminopeptidase [Gammaproteobacteria bacterium]|nr:Xaa-Pro aminopeptidase [Gammaproteobacteria bacterium]
MATVFELTGITLKEYGARRSRVLENMPPKSLAILPAGSEKYRNADAEYPFRQESDFYYLTGFCEPKSLLILLKKSVSETQFILFCQSHDPELEIWVGKKVGLDGVIEQFGADKAYLFDDLDRIMPELLKNTSEIFYSLGRHPDWDERVTGWLNSVLVQKKRAVEAPSVFKDLSCFIHEARLFKSPDEIKLMKKASEISAGAHVELIKACKTGMMEYELEALFLYECVRQGCRSMAYSSIVGGGKNACTLHYGANNAALKSGDLVLVDAGGEYQSYAADITRTFPVNGKFTEEQKLLYQLVLKAQLAAIDLVRPNTPWNILQETVVTILVEGMVLLGILKGDVKTLIDEKAYRKFYMHGSGHWLGLDVHDVGEYKLGAQYRTLQPGMVLTVEPGIYIADGEPSVDKRWWGIGIRIEDDVLVTENGHEVLTESVPKTVEEIEQLMKNNFHD